MNDALVYLDSSALLKLVFEEPESAALAAFLPAWPVRVSSALASVEVTRIVARVEDPIAAREAQRVLTGVNLVRIDDRIVSSAAAIAPSGVRALDAIHLATAHLFGRQLAGMVVYDRALAAAARRHAMHVWAPS